MKIVDLLKVESIDLKAQPKDKAAALEHLITLMESGGNLLDKDEYRACVLRREEEGSTGIGEGIAIPHNFGVIGSSAEQTEKNLGRISDEGMAPMDSTIIDVMQKGK